MIMKVPRSVVTLFIVVLASAIVMVVVGISTVGEKNMVYMYLS